MFRLGRNTHLERLDWIKTKMNEMSGLLSTGENPNQTRTFRIRELRIVKAVVEGLINHRQWFLIRPLAEEQGQLVFEVEVGVETPESGYGFTPTDDPVEFQSDSSLGLRIR